MTPSRSTRTFKASERGASLVQYTLLLACIIVICLVSVTVFGKDDSSSEVEKPKMPVATVAKVEYRGETLYCIDFEHTPEVGGFSATCDFTRFYKEHPELLESMSLKADSTREN